MAIALRKNITLSQEENDIIQEFCKKIGKSFSEVMRTATLKYIEETEKQDLATFLKNNCEYVDENEQKEIENIMAELKNDTSEGREISLDELL